MKILIASECDFKINGIAAAFRVEFPFEELEIYHQSTPSGVGRQPFNEATYLGARNRLESLEGLEGNDYAVACEAGVVEKCNMFFNYQVVVVRDRSGKTSWGTSQGFQIPNNLVLKMIDKEMSIKDIFDEVFGMEKGGISLLSKGTVTRERMIRDATLIALAGLNWPD